MAEEKGKRMKDNMPRVLFAAPKSGSGKTTIVCGMIELMKQRKLRTASIKCGPDYIDPMFHRKVLGIDAGNLDTFFTDETTTRYLLEKKAEHADITVMEGVMGYYDGLGGQSEKASTYEIAKVTRTPVILIVDAKGASVSLAAMVKGMIEYRKDSGICGVILNRVSAGYYERIKEVIERECHIEVLGYLPDMENIQVPSRHLGLILPEEMREFQTWIQNLARHLEQTVCIERILEIARKAPVCTGEQPKIPKISGKVRLAVARDEAFCFYYKENLELLQEMGAELVSFSPLYDRNLPEDIDGLLIGGGYPENYTKELEAAETIRMEIRDACKKGLPCLAECGGFLYLGQKLEGSNQDRANMAGVLSGEGFRTKKLCRFGYVELETACGGVLGEKGQKIKGHEFHYWDCTENGSGFHARKPLGAAAYDCMIHTSHMAAGFPHLYYYSNPEMMYQFLEKCRDYQAGRNAGKHWEQMAKPIDSLGLLEENVIRICKMRGSARPYDFGKKALLVFCGDHGVVKEGVTQTDSEVTKIVCENFAKGCSTVNYMAESAQMDVYTIDIGMDTPHYSEKQLVLGAVIDKKIARGTGNIAKEPAMTKAQCIEALETGKRLVKELKAEGYGIFAVGEMGIGNTTPASAISAFFLNQPVKKVTGKGAGLSMEGLDKKYQAVQAAVNRVREKQFKDPVEILAEIGGYEIAGMAGVFLGAVEEKVPVILDGAISGAAALAAVKIDARAADNMIASHVSKEAMGPMLLKALGLKAVIHGDMCLGEGSGAAAFLPMLEMAMKVYKNMGTFKEYNIGPYTRYEETKEG